MLLTALKSLYCVWLFYFSEKAKQKGMKQTVTQNNSSSHQPLWIRKSKLSKGPRFSPGFLRHKMQSIKSKGRIGTERSSPVQAWNQCTDKPALSTAVCDPGRSRLFSTKFLGNPHQGGSIRSHFINVLWLWEAREKPLLKEVPLAGIAGRIPHGSPSTSRLILQILTVKQGAMGWAGEMFTSCCLAEELLFHLASIQFPHQGKMLCAELRLPALQELHFCLVNQHGHGRTTYKRRTCKISHTPGGTGMSNPPCDVLGTSSRDSWHKQDSTNSVFALLEGFNPLFFLSWSLLFGFNS